MAVFGLGNYPKGATFTAPKSHINRVRFGFGASVGITGTPPNFTFNDLVATQNHVICNLHPSLWGDRAYALTLDHMIDDWWLLVDPNPDPIPLNFFCNWDFNATTGKPELLIWIPGMTTWYDFTLPPMYPGYWLAPT